jgi:hypothetical protein
MDTRRNAFTDISNKVMQYETAEARAARVAEIVNQFVITKEDDIELGLIQSKQLTLGEVTQEEIESLNILLEGKVQ